MIATILLLLFYSTSGDHNTLSDQSSPEAIRQVRQLDTLQQLTKVWELRQRIQNYQNNPEKDSIETAQGVVLVFQPDGTYQLIRKNERPNSVNGTEVVEEGEWELKNEKGLIGVRARWVNGQPIQNMLMYRWQIAAIKPGYLVLRQYGPGRQYLLFEEKK